MFLPIHHVTMKSVNSILQILSNNKNWTDDLESAFAIRRASVTESSAVSVEWPLLKPDCLASSLLFCERNLVEDDSFEWFGYEWTERDRSVVFYKRSV